MLLSGDSDSVLGVAGDTVWGQYVILSGDRNTIQGQ